MSILSPKKLLIRLSVAATILCVGLLQVSCLEKQAPGNRYTFTGKTVAQFLEDYKDPTKFGESEFSSFIMVVKRVGLWDRLKTYGEYTCFAPTNDAFEAYFLAQGNGYNLESLLNDSMMCDTIARTHLVNYPIYTTDLNAALVPYPNLLDRQMKVAYTDSIDSIKVETAYWIQDKVRIIEADDSVQNGVVHVISGIIPPSNKLIGDEIKLDRNITLFAEAMKLTRYADQELWRYQDMNYKTPQGDSCVMGKGVQYNTGAETGERGYFYEKRYFKYTGLIETDAVFNANSIYNIDDLKARAKTAYGSNADDNNFTSPNNYLYKFVAYHFLPEAMGYNNFNVAEVTTGDVNSRILENNYKKKDDNQALIGVEDFFETMLPHSIMRISTHKGKVFINRKGYKVKAEKTDVEVAGIEIDPNSLHSAATNGLYHYIKGILLYDNNTRTVTLNTRMRIDASTLSPDFINSGGRGGENTLSNGSTGMKKGFVKNVNFSERTKLFMRHRNAGFACYEGDEVLVKGVYDIWFKLPPVPFKGTYEVRLGYTAMSSRGVIQLYFGEMADENQNPNDYLTPRGIPLDLRMDGKNPRIGWFHDDDVTDIPAEDKAIRNRGYMKGPDTYANYRNNPGTIRRILVTEDLETDKNYFIRARQVLDDDNAEFPFDYIELVPKTIFAGDKPEDWH